jgi:hypothetical protein
VSTLQAIAALIEPKIVICHRQESKNQRASNPLRADGKLFRLTGALSIIGSNV